MRVLFIRHGDPYYPTDSLTEKGQKEAECLSKKLINEDITEIYVSPHGRAKLTAKPTADKLGITPVVFDWLREFPAMLAEDKTYNTDYFENFRSPWNMPPKMWVNDEKIFHPTLWRESDIVKGSEFVKTFDHITESFDALLADHGFVRDGGLYHVTEKGENNTDTIALFCHFGLSTVLIAHVLGMSPLVVQNSVYLPPSSVTTLFMERHIKSEPTAHGIFAGIGDTSHLFAGGEQISCSGLHTKVLR